MAHQQRAWFHTARQRVCGGGRSGAAAIEEKRVWLGGEAGGVARGRAARLRRKHGERQALQLAQPLCDAVRCGVERTVRARGVGWGCDSRQRRLEDSGVP